MKSISWTNSVWRHFYKKKWDIKQVPAFNQEKSNWKAIYKQQCIIGTHYYSSLIDLPLILIRQGIRI